MSTDKILVIEQAGKKYGVRLANGNGSDGGGTLPPVGNTIPIEVQWYVQNFNNFSGNFDGIDYGVYNGFFLNVQLYSTLLATSNLVAVVTCEGKSIIQKATNNFLIVYPKDTMNRKSIISSYLDNPHEFILTLRLCKGINFYETELSTITTSYNTPSATQTKTINVPAGLLTSALPEETLSVTPTSLTWEQYESASKPVNVTSNTMWYPGSTTGANTISTNIYTGDQTILVPRDANGYSYPVITLSKSITKSIGRTIKTN